MKLNELMKAPNVTFEEGAVEKFDIVDDTEMVCKDALLNTVWELVRVMPTWRFVAKVGKHYTNSITVDSFFVVQDGETIGRLASNWYRRNWCVAISGGRLGDYEAHRTKDIAKAVVLARRNFRKKSLGDLLATADDKSRQTIRGAASDMSRRIHHAQDKLKPYLHAFALQNRREEFAESLRGYPTAEEALSTMEQTATELDVATKVQMMYDASQYYLVVVSDSKYITKFADDSINIYDDQNFPEDLRGKLGLLKLVSAGQMVENIGARIDTQTFVLLKEA
jgi:hypothetical protein